MVSTYEFVPTAPIPSPTPTIPAEVSPENACFLGEDVSVIDCVRPGASIPSEAGTLMSDLIEVENTPIIIY
jgi:hypothetical protein